MKTPFRTPPDLSHLGPEVKSYVYQTIMEFEPFTTPNTVVAVVAKDPLKLIPQYEESGLEYDKDELRQKWRISIALTEDGNKLEEEAVHEDVFVAIRMAKEKLLLMLAEIQNNVISNQDRTQQINFALQNSTLH